MRPSRKPTTLTLGEGGEGWGVGGGRKRFLAADSSLFMLKVIFLSSSSNVIPLNNSAQAFPPSGFKVCAI